MNWNIDGILEKVGLKESSVGFAFSGGGARGFSYIGMLKALEEFGIRPNVLSGVSAGSVAAVMYGAGMSPSDMLKCFEELDKIGEFVTWKVPGNSLLRIDKFGKMLESWLPVKNLEDLDIPTIVCATDFEHGKAVGWGKGEIVPRVLASCSIPIVFEPVKINDGIYVDGGVLRNLPAWAIRRYCTTLYGLNCSPFVKACKDVDRQNLLDVALRSYRLMSRANMVNDAKLCDVLINLNGAHSINVFDVSKLYQAVQLGYETASRVLDARFNSK